MVGHGGRGPNASGIGGALNSPARSYGRLSRICGIRCEQAAPDAGERIRKGEADTFGEQERHHSLPSLCQVVSGHVGKIQHLCVVFMASVLSVEIVPRFVEQSGGDF